MSHSSLREIAMSFFDLVESGEFRKLFDKYTTHEFICHNQYFKGSQHLAVFIGNQINVTRMNTYK